MMRRQTLWAKAQSCIQWPFLSEDIEALVHTFMKSLQINASSSNLLVSFYNKSISVNCILTTIFQ